MILKKKEFFLLIFLIFLQTCPGGRIGNFLESSFNDLEKTSQNEDLQNNLLNKNDINLEKENKKLDDKKNKKIKKVEKPKNVPENKKILVKENKEINDKQNKVKKKVKNSEKLVENKKNINSEKIPKPQSNKIKRPSKKRNIDLQSYKIIFILKDVDPKDPTEELSSILSNSEVNFEIEKIERILDSKNKSMNKN